MIVAPVLVNCPENPRGIKRNNPGLLSSLNYSEWMEHWLCSYYTSGSLAGDALLIAPSNDPAWYTKVDTVLGNEWADKGKHIISKNVNIIVIYIFLNHQAPPPKKKKNLQ